MNTESVSAITRFSRLLGRLIFGALLALIVFAAVPYGTVEDWAIALFQLVVFALGALWIVEGALGGGFWLRREDALLLAPLALIPLFAYAQSVLPIGTTTAGSREVLSADPYETRLFALRLFATATFGALLLRYTTSRRRLLALALTVLAVGTLSAIFGIVRQSAQRAGDEGFVLPYLTSGAGYAQFIGRNSFAYLMEMCLGLGLGLLLGVPRQRLLLVAAALLPVWTALVLCNSRGGILSMIAQVIFAALLYFMLRPSKRASDEGREGASEPARTHLKTLFGSIIFKGALIVTLLVVTIAGTLWMGGSPLADRFETVPGELSPEVRDETGTSRQDIWRSTLSLIKAHPLAGSGFGAYWVAIIPHHKGSGAVSPQQAHNDYLELVAGGGLLGAILFLSFIYLFIRRARSQLRHPDRFRRAACFGALVGLFGAAVHSLVDFGLHVTVNSLVFAALIAVAIGRPDCRAEQSVQKTSHSVY